MVPLEDYGFPTLPFEEKMHGVCFNAETPAGVSQCSGTILHTAASLKVLSTFKEIRDIFSGGKEGLLPDV